MVGVLKIGLEPRFRFMVYLKAPRTILGLLGEGLGVGGSGLGSHYQGPRALGYIGFLGFQGPLLLVVEALHRPETTQND